MTEQLKKELEARYVGHTFEDVLFLTPDDFAPRRKLLIDHKETNIKWNTELLQDLMVYHRFNGEEILLKALKDSIEEHLKLQPVIEKALNEDNPGISVEF